MSTYTITDASRKLMHEQLDRIIDQVNKEELDPLFALPDLQIVLTRVNEAETEESIVRVGVEFTDNEDGSLNIEEEFFVHDIYYIGAQHTTDPSHPYHHIRGWDK